MSMRWNWRCENKCFPVLADMGRALRRQGWDWAAFRSLTGGPDMSGENYFESDWTEKVTIP